MKSQLKFKSTKSKIIIKKARHFTSTVNSEMKRTVINRTSLSLQYLFLFIYIQNNSTQLALTEGICYSYLSAPTFRKGIMLQHKMETRWRPPLQKQHLFYPNNSRAADGVKLWRSLEYIISEELCMFKWWNFVQSSLLVIE